MFICDQNMATEAAQIEAETLHPDPRVKAGVLREREKK